MDFKDYYSTLGVDRSASDDEIKRAYRRLARKYHPDVNLGDSSAEDRFKEINEAYEALSDPEKRKRYDAFGSNWRRTGSFDEAFQRSRGAGRVPGGMSDIFSGDGSGFSDFFETLFGGRGVARGSAAPINADVEETIDVSLHDVAEGGTRAVTLRIPGQNGETRTRRIDISIPKGIRDGQRLRVANEGAIRPDGSRGDLLLRVNSVSDGRFERRGDDIYADVEIGLAEAMLGTRVSVPTISGGSLGVRVPPETRDGTVLRLRGQGLTKFGQDDKGDMRVRVKVRLPHDLSDRERELFHELAELRGEHPVST